MPDKPQPQQLDGNNFEIFKVLNRKLLRAIYNKNPEAVKQMISEGADVNAQFSNTTPLIEALALKDSPQKYAIVNSLLENGADTNRPSRMFIAGQPPSPNTFPLFVAAQNNHTYYVQKLLDHGADPFIKKFDGTTLLLQSLAAKNTQTMELLINAAKQKSPSTENFRDWLNQRDNNGFNALHRTIKKFETHPTTTDLEARNALTKERLILLIKNGADTNAPALEKLYDANCRTIGDKKIYPIQLIEQMRDSIIANPQNWFPGLHEQRLSEQAFKRLMLLEEFKSDYQRIIIDHAPRFSQINPKEACLTDDLASQMLPTPKRHATASRTAHFSAAG